MCVCVCVLDRFFYIYVTGKMVGKGAGTTRSPGGALMVASMPAPAYAGGMFLGGHGWVGVGLVP